MDEVDFAEYGTFKGGSFVYCAVLLASLHQEGELNMHLREIKCMWQKYSTL